jgi:hypothetical protein
MRTVDAGVDRLTPAAAGRGHVDTVSGRVDVIASGFGSIERGNTASMPFLRGKTVIRVRRELLEGGDPTPVDAPVATLKWRSASVVDGRFVVIELEDPDAEGAIGPRIADFANHR